MVSVLDFRSSDLGLSPSQGHCVVFLSKTLLLSQCLSPTRCTDRYRRFQCFVGGGPSDGLAVPSRRGKNTPGHLHVMLQKPG